MSPRILVVLVLLAFASKVSAAPGGNGGPPVSPSGACADTLFHKGGDTPFGEAFRCTCSNGKVQVAGGAQIPGVAGLGGSYSGSDGGGPAACKSFTHNPDFWERIDGEGNSIVVPDGKVFSITYTATCDFSGCHQFLWVLWSYGHATCQYDKQENTPFTTYKETGKPCVIVGGPPVAATYRSPYGRAFSSTPLPVH